jgi:hypothetical protein
MQMDIKYSVVFTTKGASTKLVNVISVVVVVVVVVVVSDAAFDKGLGKGNTYSTSW